MEQFFLNFLISFSWIESSTAVCGCHILIYLGLNTIDDIILQVSNNSTNACCKYIYGNFHGK